MFNISYFPVIYKDKGLQFCFNHCFIVTKQQIINFSDIDDCNGTDLCENNGTCVDLVDGYNCDCGVDFTGQNCSTGNVSLFVLLYYFPTLQT